MIRRARQYIIMTGRANMCSCAHGERETNLLATEAIEEIVSWPRKQYLKSVINCSMKKCSSQRSALLSLLSGSRVESENTGAQVQQTLLILI